MAIGYRMTAGCRTSLDKLVREGSEGVTSELTPN